jgi:DNA-binding MarR family transcriptional regulator
MELKSAELRGILRLPGCAATHTHPSGDLTVPARHSHPGRAAYIDFGELPDLIGYQIRLAYAEVYQSFNVLLGELGLAPGQYSLLRLIALNPGITQQALGDAAGLDRSTIVPLTRAFAKRGWLRRTRRGEDRRAYSLQPTDRGLLVLKKAQPLIREHESRLTQNLSRAERRALLRSLQRLGSRAAAPKLRLTRSQLRRLARSA